MTIAIRLPEDTAFPSLRMTLDDAEFTVQLAWNQREAKWYLSLIDNNDERLLSGVKVVADFPLLTLARHDARCPAGELMALDTSGRGLDPHYKDMAGDNPRVILMYITEAELDEADEATGG